MYGDTIIAPQHISTVRIPWINFGFHPMTDSDDVMKPNLQSVCDVKLNPWPDDTLHVCEHHACIIVYGQEA